MSFNGSGTFNINSTGQPVVTGTVISSSVFNALTADLATGLSTCITKDGQTTVTANIPMNSFKFTNLAAGTAAGDSVRVSQLQAGSATSLTVTGTNTYAATASPALTAYTTGNTFSFVVPNSNTSSCTLNIDSLGAKAITRDGTTALVSGDLVAGSEVLVVYDGTQFQVVNSNSKTNWTVSNALTLSAGTANGVAYLNGSKALTTGSALVFDGTNLGIGTSSPGYKLQVASGATAATAYFSSTATPSYSATAYNGGNARASFIGGGASGATTGINFSQGGSFEAYFGGVQESGGAAAFVWQGYSGAAYAERMRLDSSGNLGLGVTPSAWSGVTALELPAYGHVAASNTQLNFSVNAYYNGGYKYKNTGTASFFNANNNSFTWNLAPSGTAGNAITFTQVMTLDASGNLSVGTTSSQGAKFAVNSGALPSGSAGLTFNAALSAGRLATGDTNNTTGVINQYLDTSITEISSGTSGAYAAGIVISGGTAAVNANTVRLFTAGTERARIDSSGNFLISKTTSSSSTVGFETGPGGTVYSTKSSNASNDASYYLYSTSAGQFQFYVTTAGTVNAVTTTISGISDQRLKENVRDLDIGLDAVMALQPRKFDWKNGKGKGIKNDRGFIAQEFEQVFPDLIDKWHTPAPEGEEPYKAIRQDLIPVLVKAMQEQQVMIEDLRARVAQLESK